MSTGKKSVCGVTRWKVWASGLAFVAMALFLSAGNSAIAATILPYDDFSSGGIDLGKWAPNFTTSFFSVVAGSSVSDPIPQSYVLHATGSGSSTFPRGALQTVDTFGGTFGAAITFFNFSHSGNLPQASDPRPPSISLVIGDFGTSGPPSHNYYLISRTMTPEGKDIIGWKVLDSSGNTIVVDGTPQKGAVEYDGASGALEVNYDPVRHDLNFGYFSSTDPSEWDETGPTQIASISDVYFTGDPRLGISYAPGRSGSSLTVDVGGLYYRPVPVPAAILLFAPGLLAIAGIGRKLKKQR